MTHIKGLRRHKGVLSLTITFLSFSVISNNAFHPLRVTLYTYHVLFVESCPRTYPSRGPVSPRLRSMDQQRAKQLYKWYFNVNIHFEVPVYKDAIHATTSDQRTISLSSKNISPGQNSPSKTCLEEMKMINLDPLSQVSFFVIFRVEFKGEKTGFHWYLATHKHVPFQRIHPCYLSFLFQFML